MAGGKFREAVGVLVEESLGTINGSPVGIVLFGILVGSIDGKVMVGIVDSPCISSIVGTTVGDTVDTIVRNVTHVKPPLDMNDVTVGKDCGIFGMRPQHRIESRSCNKAQE